MTSELTSHALDLLRTRTHNNWEEPSQRKRDRCSSAEAARLIIDEMGQGKSKEKVRASPEVRRRSRLRLPWQKAHQARGELPRVAR